MIPIRCLFFHLVLSSSVICLSLGILVWWVSEQAHLSDGCTIICGVGLRLANNYRVLLYRNCTAELSVLASSPMCSGELLLVLCVSKIRRNCVVYKNLFIQILQHLFFFFFLNIDRLDPCGFAIFFYFIIIVLSNINFLHNKYIYIF